MQFAEIWNLPAKSVFVAFIGSRESFDDDVLLNTSPLLGIASWAVVLLLIYALAMLFWGREAKRRRRDAIARGKRPFNWRMVSAAAWRAQAVHASLYLGVPLVWEAARWLVIAALLPLFIVGSGSKSGNTTDGTLRHLKDPACWTFFTVCEGPRSNVLHDPVQNRTGCDPVRGCPPAVAPVPDFHGWGWKLLWLLATGAWLLRWRRRTA